MDNINIDVTVRVTQDQGAESCIFLVPLPARFLELSDQMTLYLSTDGA